MSEEKILTLDQLAEGEKGVIEGYRAAEELHLRLKELGLVNGTRIQVKRFAPLGDPIEILVRGYKLSLRKQDAAKICVKRVAT